MRIQTKPTNALQKLRQDRDVRQREIAEYLGVADTYYSRVEKGAIPFSYDRACKIAEFFGVPAEDLFEVENRPRVISIKPL